MTINIEEWDDDDLGDWIGSNAFIINGENGVIWKQLFVQPYRDRVKAVIHIIRENALEKARNLRDAGIDNAKTRLFINELDFRLANIKKREMGEANNRLNEENVELKAMIEDLFYYAEEKVGTNVDLDLADWEFEFTNGKVNLLDWIKTRWERANVVNYAAKIDA